MKVIQNLSKAILFAACVLILGGQSAKAEITYNLYTANEHRVSPTVFEFDVFLQASDAQPFRLRTVQNSYTFNPAFINGATVIVAYIQGSSSIPNYTSHLKWSSNGNGFTTTANIAGTCFTTGITVPVYPAAIKVATYRLTCVSGQFANVAPMVNFVKPGMPDPATDLRLKTAVTRWDDPNCAVGTNTTIRFKEAAAQPLAVNEAMNSNNSMVLYPNPAAGKTGLSFTAAKSAKYLMKMYDSLGHLLKTESISASQGFNSKEINLNNLAAGVYIVSLQTDDTDMQTVHLVVQ